MVKYNELAAGKIGEKRNAVVSECVKENGVNIGFTLAQQLEVQEGGKVMKVFLKNAMHIDSYNSLISLRDCINEAISIFEENMEKMELDF